MMHWKINEKCKLCADVRLRLPHPAHPFPITSYKVRKSPGKVAELPLRLFSAQSDIA